MKKINTGLTITLVVTILLYLLLTLCIVSSINAQEKEKRFYVGVNLGTSILLNGKDSKGATGVNINLLNAGYSFNNNVGIHLKWMGAAHTISENNQVGYGGILIGPMYSLPLGERSFLDLKIATGLFWLKEQAAYYVIPANPQDPFAVIIDSNQSEASISLSNFAAGLALRHNFAKHWSFLLLTEYNSGKHSGASYYIDGKQLQAISINAGIALSI